MADERNEDQFADVKEDDRFINIDGVTVDISGVFPLTLGDWKKLQALGLLDAGANVNIKGPEDVGRLLHYMVGKVNKDVKLEDLDCIPIQKIGRAFKYVQKKLAEGEESLTPQKDPS